MDAKEFIVSTGRKLEDVSEDTILIMQEYMDLINGKKQISLFENTVEEEKISKDTFLEELNAITISDDEKEEFIELQKELEKDKEEGLLFDGEPFYVKESKLYVDRYKSDIEANISGLAKSIIDEKFKQDISLNNISFLKELDFIDTDVYSNIICMNYYGVRFQVSVQDVFNKLEKIPFE